jgi:hypothetical protein
MAKLKKAELIEGKVYMASPIDPLLNSNLAQVLQTVQQGVVTTEHEDFVVNLIKLDG